jgi:hypothetical protein
MKLASTVLALALVASTTGCVARTYGSGYGYVQATPAPVVVAPTNTVTYTTVDFDAGSTPYVVYEGRPTYYYGGAWYYREGGGWRGYSNGYEPDYLRHQRVVITGSGYYNGGFGSGGYSNGGYYNGGTRYAPPATPVLTAPPAAPVYTAPPANRRYAPPARRR